MAVAARYESWPLCWEHIDRASGEVQFVDPVNKSTVVYAVVRECIRTGTLETRATVRPRSLQPVRPDQLERRLWERLDALGPAPRAELLHVLMLPDVEQATGSASSGGTRRLGRSPSS